MSLVPTAEDRAYERGWNARGKEVERLEDELVSALAERDAAREHAVLARLREKTAEDARIHAVDTAEALQIITEQQADSIAKLERDVQKWQEAHVLAVKQREEANTYGDEDAERAEAKLAAIAEQPVLEPPPSMDMFGDDEWRFSK